MKKDGAIGKEFTKEGAIGKRLCSYFLHHAAQFWVWQAVTSKFHLQVELPRRLARRQRVLVRGWREKRKQRSRKIVMLSALAKHLKFVHDLDLISFESWPLF